VNFAQGFFRDGAIDRRHRRHRLSGEYHSIEGYHRLVFVLAASNVGPNTREIFAGEHRHHAGHRLGFRCIDRADFRVGIRTAQKFPFDHSGDQ